MNLGVIQYLVGCCLGVMSVLMVLTLCKIMRKKRKRAERIGLNQDAVDGIWREKQALFKPNRGYSPKVDIQLQEGETCKTETGSHQHIEWPKVPEEREDLSAGWKEFVRDRLFELSLYNSIEESCHALSVVDFLDELRSADIDASEEERDFSLKIQSEIKNILIENGYTVLDSTEWNPEIQRAVFVEHKPDAEDTKIIGKGASGLARRGKIIRKQEVKIIMKRK